MNKKGYGILTTSITLEDETFEDVMVEYEVSRAEPDVNWPGGIDIISITTAQSENITDRVSGRYLDELLDECAQHAADRAEDPRY